MGVSWWSIFCIPGQHIPISENLYLALYMYSLLGIAVSFCRSHWNFSGTTIYLFFLYGFFLTPGLSSVFSISASHHLQSSYPSMSQPQWLSKSHDSEREQGKQGAQMQKVANERGWAVAAREGLDICVNGTSIILDQKSATLEIWIWNRILYAVSNSSSNSGERNRIDISGQRFIVRIGKSMKPNVFSVAERGGWKEEEWLIGWRSKLST